MTAERSDASVVTEDGEVTGPPTLAIDATGLMLWPPGKGLAGIPRVESFLINAALADPDPCVDVVAFRPGEGRFRPLAPYEQEHVATGEISPRRVKRWPGRRMALSQAFEAVRQEPGDKREADRHLPRHGRHQRLVGPRLPAPGQRVPGGRDELHATPGRRRTLQHGHPNHQQRRDQPQPPPHRVQLCQTRRADAPAG